VGKKEFVPSIGPFKAKVGIANTVQKHKPKKFGNLTLYGYSAILMASLLDDGTEDMVALKSIKLSLRLRKNIEGALFSKVGDALEVIPKLGGKFDLLFIDVNNENTWLPMQLN
jgi:hypothetical protein